MNTNGMLKKHWEHVWLHFFIDAAILVLALIVGTWLRLPEHVFTKIHVYWPALLLGAGLLPSLIYIFGQYSLQSAHEGMLRRTVVVTLCFGATLLLLFSFFYWNKSTTIGRGVLLWGALLAYFSLLIHHGLIQHHLENFKERVAFVVSCGFDEMEARFFQSLGNKDLELAGVIHYDSYRPSSGMKVLGRISQMRQIVDQEGVDRVLCTNKSLNDPAMCSKFCELRYSGVTVMSLISVFEEVYQMVPIELVSTEWLLHASGHPHMFYIRKVKRAFDIIAALGGLVVLGPLLLAGMVLVRLTSAGPVFYRQVRSGRFGKPFEVLKLRTMRVDAEKHGAVWAKDKDPRVTPVGGFLRKYRVDEIPQLINVLRGEMSFVGPRPERPEFIKSLSEQIPHFQERLMVQAGITGWAQVNYPYGSSIEDARRKLEYDLYYAKNMSLFLDIMILLDTVRIIVCGGLDRKTQKAIPRLEKEPASSAQTPPSNLGGAVAPK